MFAVGTIALVTTVVLAEGLDTDLASHVELVGNGGGAEVKPVIVVGAEFIGAGGLNVASPLNWYIIIKLLIKVFTSQKEDSR